MRVLVNQRYRAEFRKEFFGALSDAVAADFIFNFGCKDSKDFELVREFGDEVRIKAIFSKYVGFCHGKLQWQCGILPCLRRIRPETVVITPTPRVLSNYLWVLLCALLKIKVVGWGMGEMPGRTGVMRWLHRTAQATLVRPLDAIICYSSVAAEYYSSLGFSGPITICPNTVDVETADGWAREAEVKHSEGRYLDDRVREIARSPSLQLLFLGRITPEKRIEDVIRAISLVGSPQLNIIGDCRDVELKKSLRALAAQMGVKVRWFGHQVGRRLAEVAVACDVMVLPGRGGLAINHAMAHGLPVICSVADGTEVDLVINGVTGYLFDHSDVVDLARVLAECMNNRKLVKRLGGQARAHVKQNFSVQSSVNVFIEGLRTWSGE